MKKNDHKFKGDLYPLFYGKKKAFFVGLIKNNKFFAINLCLFIALIYGKKYKNFFDSKENHKNTAFFCHKFMGTNCP